MSEIIFHYNARRSNGSKSHFMKFKGCNYHVVLLLSIMYLPEINTEVATHKEYTTWSTESHIHIFTLKLGQRLRLRLRLRWILRMILRMRLRLR